MFLEYRLKADRLVISERMKMGVYRPAVATIPCSTIMGTLRDYGIEDVYAAGYLDGSYPETNKIEELVLSHRDTATDGSDVPLIVEYISNVKAKIFIRRKSPILNKDNLLADLCGDNTFVMGGLKSKGFGDCGLEFIVPVPEHDCNILTGRLKTRLYELYPSKDPDADIDFLKAFLIEEVYKPYYCYLFIPTSIESGYYQRSLKEGSLVKGPRFLVDEIKEDEYGVQGRSHKGVY